MPGGIFSFPRRPSGYLALVAAFLTLSVFVWLTIGSLTSPYAHAIRALSRDDRQSAIRGFHDEVRRDGPHSLQAIEKLTAMEDPQAFDAIVELFDVPAKLPESRFVHEDCLKMLHEAAVKRACVLTK